MVRSACLALLSVLGTCNAGPSPIRKVVTLIEEMKAQVEKEAQEDLAAYEEYKCWCDTNGKEKKEAIAYATDKISDLEAFLQEAAGTEGQLKTEISGLEDDIASDNDALATGRGVRAKENDDFQAYEADSKESVGLLAQAISVLSNVQLAQKDQHQVETALLQVQHMVEQRPRFQGVMQKDLFDLLGSLQGVGASGKSFLPKAALEQQGPNSLTGQAAGSKSYNSRSGSILGILDAMKDEFQRDLSSAQKAEFHALVAFQKLQAAKLAEIAAAGKQKDLKESALADLLNRVAKSNEDLENMKAAKAADEKFVAELEKNCQVVDQEYETRNKIRSDELVALAQTIEILTSDDARDLFAKSVGTSFVQESMTQERRVTRALNRLGAVAKKTNNWSLLAFVSKVRLDAFTRVKEAMDKLLADLKKQQSDEVAKHDLCNKEIDETEDNIKVANNEKKDLAEKHQDLTNTLDTLADEIKTLKQEVADMEVSLKRAGIDRKSENQLYQQHVADQRATVKVLNMALDRLKAFYTPSLAQIRQHQPVPGAAAPPPPEKPKAYEKSAAAGGVLQLMAKIISEAESEEKELELDENQAQKMYAAFVQDTSSSIEADRQSIAEKEKHTAETLSERSSTKESQLANDEKLEKLGSLLNGLHANCDYIIKYFDLRQKYRAEEMDSIEEAKAILSGADFSS